MSKSKSSALLWRCQKSILVVVVVVVILGKKEVTEHPFSTYAKCSEKLDFLPRDAACNYICVLGGEKC